MEFNEWYHFWYEHRGFCPICGKYMSMSLGCINGKCPLAKKSMESDAWVKRRVQAFSRYLCSKKKRDDEFYESVRRRKERNLDTSQKKHYIEADNQRVSE